MNHSSLHVKCCVTHQETAVSHKREIMVHLSGSEGPAGAHQLCARLPRERHQANLFKSWVFFFLPCEKLAPWDKDFLLLLGTLDIYKEVWKGSAALLGFNSLSCFLTQKVGGTLPSPLKSMFLGDIGIGLNKSNTVKSRLCSSVFFLSKIMQPF